MRHANLFLCLALIAVASGVGKADDARGRLGPVDTDKFPEVAIVLERPNAFESDDGAPATEEVFLLEDGKLGEAAFESVLFRDLEEGICVAVLVDVSGSMRGGPIEAVRDGLGHAVERGRVSDRLRLASLADELRWESDWNDSAERVGNAIRGLEPRGTRTRIWDGLREAASELTDPARVNSLPKRKRILLVSDGHDEGSTTDRDELIEALRAARIVLDVIAITTVTDGYLDSLRELASVSGGTARAAPDSRTLERLVSSGIDHVLDMPVYRFHLSEIEADGKEHWFSLRVEGTTLQDNVLASVPKLPAALVFARRAGPWVWSLALIPVVGVVYALRRRKPATPASAPPRVYRTHGDSPRIPEASGTAATNPPARMKTEPASASPCVASASTPEAASIPEPAPPASPAPHQRTVVVEQFAMPASERPVVMLEARKGPRRGMRFGVDSVDFWIGAAPENNLIVVDDPTLSGMHARIRFSDNAIRIHDNSSTNGTWLNGSQVDAAGRLLQIGDSLRVGNSVFEVTRPSGAVI